MAIVQGACTAFKLDMVKGDVDLDTDTLNIALYTSDATLNADTTVYITADEVVGTGYDAGGKPLTVTTPTTSQGVVIVDFANVVWDTVSITARGALIYNVTNANRAVAVLDFGIDRVSDAANFTVTFPEATVDSAIIRIE